MNGATGDVFRAGPGNTAVTRDRHGDPRDTVGNPVEITDKDGLAYIGTLTNIVMGSTSATRTERVHQESADGGGQIGILKTQTPKVQFGDRIVISGQTFEVTSDPNWDTAHSLTGTVFSRYWVNVIYRR